MKKFYIALFALALNGVPAYGAECGVLCNFTCGSNRVEPITVTAPQTPAAPVAQAMEAPTPATVTPMPTITLPTPTVQAVPERKKPIPLELTGPDMQQGHIEKMKERIINHKLSATDARIAVEMGLQPVPEYGQAPIPLTLIARPPLVQDNPDRILLDAIKGKNPEKARALLKTSLSKTVLNKKTSKGKSPLDYAIQHQYWDIVDNLLVQGVKLPSLILVTAISKGTNTTDPQPDDSELNLKRKKWDKITDRLLSVSPSEILLNTKIEGKTPLLYAIHYGRWDIVEKLLSHEQNIRELPNTVQIQSLAPKGQEIAYARHYTTLALSSRR